MMSSSKSALAALLCLSALSVAAQTAAVPAKYSNEAVVVEHFDRDEIMHADGTGEVKTHAVVHILNEAGAREFNVLTLSFASANEEAEITGVRITKPDGRVVETPSSDAIEMPAEVTRTAPLYSDLKEKQLPLRSIAGGDTLEYTFLVRRKQPQAPGQFWGAENFIKAGLVVLSETLALHTPADKYVQVWSPKSKPTISDSPTGKTYVWTSTQLKGSAKKKDDNATDTADDDDDDTDEKLPDVAWTTFKSWAEVGAWYRSLALERAKPTDELKAQTDRIIAEAKTPEEKIRLIYTYVSTRTRYIGIDLGIGRYQPHTAMTVFENQYGDCKDKDTLLEAMLQSAGFTTAPALIGAGVDLSPDIPSPGFFNHVITTVAQPGGSTIWLDSTPELSPFAYLVNPLRDKQALVVPATGDAHLAKTPANPPFPLTWDFKAEGTLSDKGEMKAQVDALLRDDNEVTIRTLIRNVSPAKWDDASQYIVRLLGFGGTTSQTVFSRPEETDKPFEMKWDYTRSPYGEWDKHLIVPLFVVIDLPNVDEKKPPKSAIKLGPPRKEHSVSIIHVPAGYHVELPDPVHVKNDWIDFDKTYRFDQGTVTAERTIVVHQSKVPPNEWKKYVAFTKSVSVGEEQWITLLPPSRQEHLTITIGKDKAKSEPKHEKKAPNTTIPLDATMDDLRAMMREKGQAKDYEGAKRVAEEMLRRDPKAPQAHAALGMVAAMQGDFKTFETELIKEAEISPDDEVIITSIAHAQSAQKRDEDAEKTLLAHLDHFSTDESYVSMLAQLQAKNKHQAKAVTTLKPAIDAHPDSTFLKDLYLNALRDSGDRSGAAAVAKSMLSTAEENPDTLNSAAYALAETATDLPLAESKASHAVQILETQTASVHIAEANQHAFANSYSLIATWDTLGWIYFLEGKTTQALPVLRAAWLGDANVEVGYHLGRALEASNKEAAIATYQQALKADRASNQPLTCDKVKARLKLLHADEGSKHTVEDLQNLRMMKIARPKGITGAATYRFQISAKGITDLQLVQGEEKLRPLSASLKTLQLPEGIVPANSTAVLLRDAVVSCNSAPECDVVLMTQSGTAQEQIQ